MVKLLGGVVSRDKGFIKEVVMKRAVRAVELMHLLSKLRDPQSELLLLRSCMVITKKINFHFLQSRFVFLYFDNPLYLFS
jgi:hypothetical protein